MGTIVIPGRRTNPRAAPMEEEFPNSGIDEVVEVHREWIRRDLVWKLGYHEREYTYGDAIYAVAFVDDPKTPFREEPILIDDGGTFTVRDNAEGGVEIYQPVLKIALRRNAPRELHDLVRGILGMGGKRWGSTIHIPLKPVEEGTVLYAIERSSGQEPQNGRVKYLHGMVDKGKLLQELGLRPQLPTSN